MPNPVKRDLELTRRELTGWLANKIPAASDLSISQIHGPPTTGFSSETLLFTATWREGGEARSRELVARLEPTGFNVRPSYDIPLQFRVMSALEQTDVPMPHMHWLEEDTSVIGVPFYVMDRVAGKVPNDQPPYHAGGWVNELPPERRGALWWNGLGAMARIHRLDWRALGFESLAQPERGETHLQQQLHYYDECFGWGMDRSRYPFIQAALDYLVANMPAAPQPGLCWGDSRLTNQIFRNEECVAVIDWESVHLGSPVEDLAGWLMSDRCFSQGISLERSEGFPSHAQTVERWEQITGMSASDLPYYEVLALMRLSIEMARIGLQMKHYEVLPEENDFDVDNLASKTLRERLTEAGALADCRLGAASDWPAPDHETE